MSGVGNSTPSESTRSVPVNFPFADVSAAAVPASAPAPADGGDADGSALEKLSARQARRLPPLLEIAAAEVLTGRKLLRVLEGIVLNLVAHLLSFPPASRREYQHRVPAVV